MRRWGWWGLTVLGLLTVAGALWTLRAPEGTGPKALRVASARGSSEWLGGAPDAALGAGGGADAGLREALSVSFLDTAVGSPPPLSSRRSVRLLLPVDGGMHLARARANARAVPEAPGLVPLALAVLLGAGRRGRRTRAGLPTRQV